MYYATYNVFGNETLMEFKTKAERDKFVKFQDDFSKSTGESRKLSWSIRKIIPAYMAKELLGFFNHTYVFDIYPGASGYVFA